MISYFIIGATIIIPFVGLILIAKALGTNYKYRDLDATDEPIIILGQGDNKIVIRPSDLKLQEPELGNQLSITHDEIDDAIYRAVREKRQAAMEDVSMIHDSFFCHMEELDKMEAVMEERIRREQEFPLDYD